jgi:N-acetylneuraminic acid mutarotase
MADAAIIFPMTRSLPVLFCLLLAATLHAAQEPKLSPLPSPVSNNAVAISHGTKNLQIFSFMGIGPKKTWDAITNSAYRLDLSTGKWTELRPVPGVAGRLAASAAAFHEQVFIVGGYVVDGQGGETTVSDVNVYVPAENRYYRGADIPTPVRDSVIGVYRDRYIYLISGWSGPKADAVRNVQVYDTEKDRWMEATPIPGTPVFGHAGAIVGNTIVYLDGAYKNPSGASPKYVASSECWMGKITKHDPTKIEWSKLPAHPGSAHYRIAVGASEKEGRIYFSGGSDNPYNYNGTGYNGQPSEPSPVTFAFNVRSGKWQTVSENTPDPTMDHRGLLITHRGLILVGGMEKGQQVSAQVRVVKLGSKK